MAQRRTILTENGNRVRLEDGRRLATQGVAYNEGRTPYVETPYLVVVRRNDPDFERARRKQLEYDFSPIGRKFYANPLGVGAYGYQFSDQFNDQFGGISKNTSQADEGGEY